MPSTMSELLIAFDSFVWAPTLPDENIGLDDRNQLELFQAMPGGYDALRSLHEAFYAEGVRVIWVD